MAAAEGAVLDVGVGGLSVDREKLAALAEPDADTSPWDIEGAIDWGRAELVRLISASLEDGTLVAVAALRPSGSGDHGSDLVAGLLSDGEGALAPLHEALISTEFGPDGRPRRIGLELYPDAESAPVRVAAEIDAEGAERHATNSWACELAGLEVRSGGHTGRGLYETLTSP